MCGVAVALQCMHTAVVRTERVVLPGRVPAEAPPRVVRPRCRLLAALVPTPPQPVLVPADRFVPLQARQHTARLIQVEVIIYDMQSLEATRLVHLPGLLGSKDLARALHVTPGSSLNAVGGTIERLQCGHMHVE